MPVAMFDYRKDIRNVVVTPEIRCRFMRLEPGAVTTVHSHDGAHEVFLILEGQCEFEIEGEKATAGPGQMVFCPAEDKHILRVVGSEPVYLYLSVSPHRDPTHTFYNEDGTRKPPRYGRWIDR